MAERLTEAQAFAVRWLRRAGGSGLLDKHTRVVAGGEVFPKGQSHVWLRLLALGLICNCGSGRIGLTTTGAATADSMESSNG